MSRYFINSRSIDGDSAEIVGSDVHHIRDVLRLKAGDSLTLIDESATEHTATVESFSDSSVICKITGSRPAAAPAEVVALFQGSPKGSKFDEIVKKATELGADIISPVIMERSISRPDAGHSSRTERRRRIAEAAAKQSRRLTVPRVTDPLSWSAFLAELKDYDAVIVFWEGATAPIDPDLVKLKGGRFAVVIGPEGGLAAREVTDLTDAGASVAWLGPRILRTETAPVVALALVNHLLGR